MKRLRSRKTLRLVSDWLKRHLLASDILKYICLHLIIVYRLLTSRPLLFRHKQQMGSPQTEKSKKYDRQLRLWGDEGQSLIESGNVCIIGAGGVGCEILKNLILPGIGSFTIVDDHVVQPDDVSTNFFLTHESIGQNRGKIACKNLLELNDEVRGGWCDESLQQLVTVSNGKFFKTFNVVILTEVVNENILIQLADLLYEHEIPLIVTKVNGMFAYIRLQLREHVIIDSKPDSVLEDLRLDDPPNAFKEFCDQQDMETMSRSQFAHTPYIVFLYKYLTGWRKMNGKLDNELPVTRKEKDDLRNLLKKGLKELEKKLTAEDDREMDLTNVEEAVKAVNLVLNPSRKIPDSTRQVIELLTSDTRPKNKKFWLMISALDKYIQERGCLPLRGSIPDMTCDSERYIQLQKIYSHQAKIDAEHFTQILNSISDDVEFSASEISNFCKNSHSLRVIRTGKLSDEFGSKGDDETQSISTLRQMITTDDVANDRESIMSQYLLFRAVDDFYQTHQRLPGNFRDQQEEDVILLKSCLKRLLSKIGISYAATTSREDLIQSFVSFGGSELHNVAAFVGGVVGQEAIKILTSQFVPVDHTLIYSAITSLTQTVKF